MMAHYKFMVFSSTIFLFLFLPVTLFFYFSLILLFRHHRWKFKLGNTVLLLAGLFFYAWDEGTFLPLLLLATFIDYAAALIMDGALWPRFFGGYLNNGIYQIPDKIRKRILTVTIISNLSLLIYFKYTNFAVLNFNNLLKFINQTPPSWLSQISEVTLPLGISFYTFHAMSYGLDVYYRKIRASRSLLDYYCYITLFPQLVAGPIVRYSQISKELIARQVSLLSLSEGAQRFILGLAKKVLLANIVAEPADVIFNSNPAELTAATAWLGIVCYTLQIYFDFSGYSDMAIGLGKMFGFRFLENFNYPYFATSIQDFWRRWHISLSTWFRDYLYIAMGGNKHGNFRTYFNLFTVFFLCGLWHGASWNFAIWGIYHGCFLVTERLGFSNFILRLPRILKHSYVIIVIMISWVFFRAETLGQATEFMLALIGQGQGDGIALNSQILLTKHLVITLVLAVVISTPVYPWLQSKMSEVKMNDYTISTFRIVALGSLLILCAISIAAGTHNPFIYYRF